MEIYLTQNKIALIDREDWPKLRSYTWCANNTGKGWYAVTSLNGKLVYMTSFILEISAGILIDHIDGNGLNNCKSNLRLATPSQNAANREKKYAKASSQYKGVYWHKNGYWVAEIKVNYKKIYLGYFKIEGEAAQAYDRAAKLHFKEFARTNFKEKS